MEINTIVRLINKKLADEQEPRSVLEPFMDSAIDEINAIMNTIFPVFSELPTTTLSYTAFPDMYIRTVVVPYAAWAYYTTDEEGVSSSMQYKEDWNKGLFLMLRDYSEQVAEEDMAPMAQGGVRMLEDDPVDGEGLRGVMVDGQYFTV